MKWLKQKYPNLEINRHFNINMKYILILTLAFFNLFASQAFMSSSELKESLNNKELIVIDVANFNIYKTSHIKGAIHLDISKLINEDSQYHLMNSAEILEDEIRELGINNNSKVVIYSHNTKDGILNSSYAAFVLIHSGLENVSILDGGYMSWVFENELLTSTVQTQKKDYGNFKLKINSNLLVTKKQLKENISLTTILDARSPQMYYGVQRSENITSIGHIPHSKSSFYMDKFLSDSTLREQNQLDDIYINGHELIIYNEVIVYSDTIFSASMEWYILYQQMGIKSAKIYEASLLEWGNDESLPMTRFKWE